EPSNLFEPHPGTQLVPHTQPFFLIRTDSVSPFGSDILQSKQGVDSSEPMTITVLTTIWPRFTPTEFMDVTTVFALFRSPSKRGISFGDWENDFVDDVS